MDEDDSMTKEDGWMKDWRPPHTQGKEVGSAFI
jgi:hypothetical protein